MTTGLAERLASPDPEERRLAAQALAREVPPAPPAMLVTALGDTDWRVRKEAAQTAVLLPRREDVLRALADALGDKTNIGLRNAAVEALVAIGPEAVTAATRALRALDADGRKLAVEVLGGIPDPRGAKALVAALGDPDPNVRQAAAEALGGAALAGDEARKIAMTGLRQALVASEPMMKLAGLDALRRLDVVLDWSVLAPLTKDPMVRSAAFAACARCSDSAAAEALADGIFDASQAVARAALVALAEWVKAGVRAGLPVDAVRAKLQLQDGAERARTLDDGDPAVTGAVLVVLGVLGDAEGASRVAQALLDPDLAPNAEVALSLLGAPALPALLAVAEREPPLRHAALLLMVPSLTGRLDEESLAALRGALANISDDVAAAAAQVLGVLGDGTDIERLAVVVPNQESRAAHAAVAAIDALTERFPAAARSAFDHIAENASLTLAACSILEALGRAADATHLEYLQRALGGGDPRARRAAIEALASIGGEVARANVAMALADEERDVQLAAVRALGILRHGAALRDLVRSASDPEIVAVACGALSQADPEAALEVCTTLVKAQDAAIAGAAVAALGTLVDSRAKDALFTALEHPNDEVVRLALSELGRSIDARVLTRLGFCLDHASWQVRRLAAELLGGEGSPAAIDLLRARLEREPDPTVREAILLSIAQPFGDKD